MIVDDELSIRQSLQDYLEDQQWRVILAESGEQALELLKTDSPDIAIVDIRMGGIDGNRFILEAQQFKPGMKFVIYTGSPEFVLSPDLLETSTVTCGVFKKTETDIDVLEQELQKLIA